MRISPAVAAVSLLLSGSMAQAAARAVLLPVVVGSGGEPSAPMMMALGKGLQENPGWSVVQGADLKSLMLPPSGLKEADRTRLGSALAQAAQQIAAGEDKAAVASLEAVRTELAAAGKDTTFVDVDHDLVFRTGGLLVAALVAGGEGDRAKLIAAEVAAQFPGRKPGDSDKLPEAAAQLLTASTPTAGIKLTFKTRPEGCEVFVNGSSTGRAPVEILASPEIAYQASASCAGAAGAPASRSFPKRVVVGEKETSRQELLDVEFERSFEAEGGQRLRFASSADRRQLEEGFARRVAERYGAQAVILASVGELSGADWLNGRLYLASGYLNREALVRLENIRAGALGRFLATGRDSPGVLKPEEAGQLVAASQASAAQAGKVDPWYTDVVGWGFTGVGALGITLGILSNAAGQRTMDRADAIRGDRESQDALFRDADRSKFLGNIGVVGGSLFAVTGIVLLAIPEYTSSQGELFVFVPAKGGGTLSVSGRF